MGAHIRCLIGAAYCPGQNRHATQAAAEKAAAAWVRSAAFHETKSGRVSSKWRRWRAHRRRRAPCSCRTAARYPAASARMPRRICGASPVHRSIAHDLRIEGIHAEGPGSNRPGFRRQRGVERTCRILVICFFGICSSHVFPALLISITRGTRARRRGLRESARRGIRPAGFAHSCRLRVSSRSCAQRGRIAPARPVKACKIVIHGRRKPRHLPNPARRIRLHSPRQSPPGRHSRLFSITPALAIMQARWAIGRVVSHGAPAGRRTKGDDIIKYPLGKRTTLTWKVGKGGCVPS